MITNGINITFQGDVVRHIVHDGTRYAMLRSWQGDQEESFLYFLGKPLNNDEQTATKYEMIAICNVSRYGIHHSETRAHAYFVQKLRGELL